MGPRPNQTYLAGDGPCCAEFLGWYDYANSIGLVSFHPVSAVTCVVQSGWVNFTGYVANWRVPVKVSNGYGPLGAVEGDAFYATIPRITVAPHSTAMNCAPNLAAGDNILIVPLDSRRFLNETYDPQDDWMVETYCLDAPYGDIRVKPVSGLPRGWAVCDGTSPTPDLRTLCLRKRKPTPP